MNTEIINAALIEIDSKLESKEEVISKFAELLHQDERIDSIPNFLEDVYLRELEAPTSMGFGVAIPHSQSKHVKTSSLTFIKLKNGIQWGSDSDIKLVFGIAVPYEKRENEHLKILSNLARKMMNEEFREQLLQLDTAEEALSFLQFLND